MSGFPKRESLTASPVNAIAGMESRLRVAFRRVKSLYLRDDGISALEFALLAPLAMSFILFVGAIGITAKNYISLQQVVRAGASAAASDPGAGAVLERMKTAAIAKGYAVTGATSEVPSKTLDDLVYITSQRVCYCVDNMYLAKDCTVICLDGRPVVASYVLQAVYTDSTAIKFLFSLINIFTKGGHLLQLQLGTHVVIR